MKSKHLHAMFLAALTIALSAVPAGSAPGADEEEAPKITSPGKKLVFPALIWTYGFPEEVVGAALAGKTGQLAAATSHKVYYFEPGRPDAVWDAGQGVQWKHIDDVGISWNGDRVLFQTDIKQKKSTEAMNLTIHLLDGQGNQLWEKLNPYRYEDAMLSPSGKYIIIGEALHTRTKVFDDNLNLLWEREMQFWYLAFDPLERYLFDGEGGILYNIAGEQVWDFGRYTLILSVSDNAEFVMTKYYRTVKSSQRMFLMGRLALKKIEFAGTGGCISPDGTYTAFVSADKKLVVYRTRELLSSGAESLPPLFQTGYLKPTVMHISRDNRSLFVLGEENQLITTMMLVDLTRMKVAWKKSMAESIRVALPTEDNREVVVQAGPITLRRYRCY